MFYKAKNFYDGEKIPPRMKSRKKKFFILTIKSSGRKLIFCAPTTGWCSREVEEGDQEISGRMKKLLEKSVRLAAFAITYCPLSLALLGV